MIRMEIKQVGQKEWHEITCQFEDLSLIQLWEYAEVKARVGPWKVARHLFWKGNEIVGAAQGLIRTIPFLNKGLVWMNRAPLWRKIGEKKNPVLFEEMLKELRKYWVDKKKMYLRIAPPLLDNEGNKSILKKATFSLCNPSFKWTSARINLTKTEQELRKGLKQKWRNCLNKAEHLGLSFEFGTSRKLMEELVFDYKKLLQNRKFKATISPDLINMLQNLLPDEKKMWIFTGKHNSERLGSILIACYGNTCGYLIGAVNDVGKKHNAGQFLLWQAICQMKKMGYKSFDVGGADPERTPPGILYFKQGLGGESYRLVGEFEACSGRFFPQLVRYVVGRRRFSK